MPEVRELLERKLDPNDSGSFVARAMYGWHFGLLNWIDRDWLARHVDAIFDLDRIESEPEKAYGWAAWNTFLVASPAHIRFYELLREQFRYAVDQASRIEDDDDVYDRPFDKLGEHLMVLYARDDLTLDTDERLIPRFFEKAPRRVRTHAIEFVGRVLDHEKKPLDGALVARLTDLWDWYWQAVGRDDAQQNPASMVFSDWFASGVFDDAWSLERLEEVLRVAPQLDGYPSTTKRFAEVASVDLACSVRILKLLIEGDAEHWRIGSWHDAAKSVLADAMQAGGETAELAEEVIDLFGRRGFLDFGELLPEPV